jgi:hypothetical protein
LWHFFSVCAYGLPLVLILAIPCLVLAAPQVVGASHTDPGGQLLFGREGSGYRAGF